MPIDQYPRVFKVPDFYTNSGVDYWNISNFSPISQGKNTRMCSLSRDGRFFPVQPEIFRVLPVEKLGSFQVPDFPGSTWNFSGGSGWKTPFFSCPVFLRLNRKICDRFFSGCPVSVEPENRAAIPDFERNFDFWTNFWTNKINTLGIEMGLHFCSNLDNGWARVIFILST